MKPRTTGTRALELIARTPGMTLKELHKALYHGTTAFDSTQKLIQRLTDAELIHLDQGRLYPLPSTPGTVTERLMQRITERITALEGKPQIDRATITLLQDLHDHLHDHTHATHEQEREPLP